MGLCIGNFSNDILPTSVKESIGADTPMYGVKFDGTNSAGIRTYNAATLNWAPSTASVAGVDDFVVYDGSVDATAVASEYLDLSNLTQILIIDSSGKVWGYSAV